MKRKPIHRFDGAALITNAAVAATSGAAKQNPSGRAVSQTDDLVAQLRALIDKVGSTYSSSVRRREGFSFSA